MWALPFLTLLAPSERYAQKRGRRHKKLTDWGRQALLQTARWLPDRRIVAVADAIRNAADLPGSLSVRATDEACIYLKHPLFADDGKRNMNNVASAAARLVPTPMTAMTRSPSSTSVNANSFNGFSRTRS